MSFVAPNPNSERKLSQRDRARSAAKQESIHDAIRTFLGNAQTASKNGTCLNCGLPTDLKAKATVSLPETGETWKISLPVCERCVSQEVASAAHSEYEPSQLVDCVSSELRLQ